ncbi:MAG: sodium:proton exchanger, partial [Deinococcus-Thermus bacterium]|nr:sodium:proton exchanger [Deinococcota bacterium]
MDAWHVLIEIVVLLVAALACGLAAEQLRQHAIVGYLVAGAVVGPNALGLISNPDRVAQIAELGVALLLFSIGLEFSVPRLRRLGRVALVGGALQIVLTALLFALGASALGLDADAAVAIGMMVALSSTALVFRLLHDRAEIDTVHGRGAVGVLLMQDVAVVPAVLLISVMAGRGGMVHAAQSVGLAIVLGAVMVGVFYALFSVLMPRVMLLKQLVRNRELPVLLAVVMALGATVVAHELGLSPALGAFAAGLLLAGSPFAAQIRSDVGPLKTVLVTLFFASIGMLFNPGWALAHWHWVLGLLAAVVVGKTVIIYGIIRLLRLPGGVALATGLCLAQIGEFSFVLVDLAYGQGDGPGLITENTFRLVLAVTMLSLLLTPYTVRAAPHAARWFERHRPTQPRRGACPPLAAHPAGEPPARPGRPSSDHIVVVGFGPAAQRVVTRLLRHFRDKLCVVDMNPRNLTLAEGYGIGAQHGDACAPDLLEHIHLEHARALVITLPDIA